MQKPLVRWFGIDIDRVDRVCIGCEVRFEYEQDGFFGHSIRDMGLSVRVRRTPQLRPGFEQG